LDAPLTAITLKINIILLSEKELKSYGFDVNKAL